MLGCWRCANKRRSAPSGSWSESQSYNQEDGSLWSWGSNSYGQLGIGTTVDQWFPGQVSSLSNVAAAAGGTYHSVAAKSDGTVWAWDIMVTGRLGMGQQLSEYAGTGEWVKRSGGGGSGRIPYDRSQSDGTVWAWGYNGYGQIGDGTTTQRNTPVQVSGLSGVIAVAAGQYFSLALKSDGTVWGWGSNNYGMLGNGTTTNSPSR